MKILVVLGTRPEAIKLAPVIGALREMKADLKVCNTGQHREMLEQVFNFFNIEADIDLDLMEPDQNLNSLSSKILSGVDKVLNKEKPDVVIVQGDTTSAAMTALACFHRSIKIAHVEAGLRTYLIKEPFPEEMNRQFIGKIASMHFAPTQRAADNLKDEGISEDKILVTGNTVIDALEKAKLKLKDKTVLSLPGKRLISPSERFILVTGHRRENHGKKLTAVCRALKILSHENNLKIIFPVHLNPAVKKVVYQELADNEDIILLSPLGYESMLWLMKNCLFIISDSGGIQEEAPSFGKKILLTRDYTERPEGVDAGWTIPVGSSLSKIILESEKILKNANDLSGENPYGDGKATERILNNLFRNGN